MGCRDRARSESCQSPGHERCSLTRSQTCGYEMARQKWWFATRDFGSQTNSVNSRHEIERLTGSDRPPETKQAIWILTIACYEPDGCLNFATSLCQPRSSSPGG